MFITTSSQLEVKAILDISELSRAKGFSASKLRHDEEVGLIRSEGRRGLKHLFEMR